MKTLLYLGLKYHGNLLSYCSNLPSFQAKFNVINIPMVIWSKMAVNYHSICFITLAPEFLITLIDLCLTRKCTDKN